MSPAIADLRAVTDTPVLIADQDGLITYVNDAFEREFGWTSAEAVGQPLTIIIPHGLRHAHHMGFSRFLTTGQPMVTDRPITLKAVDKSGVEFDAEHFIVAERQGAGWLFAAAVKPLR